MKSDGPLKHFVIAFLLAVICYAVFYFGIEHRRNTRGPWHVAFTNTPAGLPALIVNQPSIGVTNVQICFEGAQLPPAPASANSSTNEPPPTVPISVATSMVQQFEQPWPVPFNVPFGKCVFMDTTFLPGTITFEFFGHEVELLPRVLVIDFQEHPWQSGSTITVPPVKPPPAAPKKSQ